MKRDLRRRFGFKLSANTWLQSLKSLAKDITGSKLQHEPRVYIANLAVRGSADFTRTFGVLQCFLDS